MGNGQQWNTEFILDNTQCRAGVHFNTSSLLWFECKITNTCKKVYKKKILKPQTTKIRDSGNFGFESLSIPQSSNSQALSFDTSIEGVDSILCVGGPIFIKHS